MNQKQPVGQEELHEIRVRSVCMKNITFSADDQLIERARLVARSQHKTLNVAFSEWLTHFTASTGDEQSFDALMKRLSHIEAGGHFTRDEMNTRTPETNRSSWD